MDSSVTGPRLCFRGGGASSKRKEARKRKFDQIDESTAGTKGGNGTVQKSVADRFMTTEKPQIIANISRAPSAGGASPWNDTSSYEADEGGQDESDRDEADQSKPAMDGPETSKQKSQRFIVFVGTYHLSFLTIAAIAVVPIKSGNLPYTATEEAIRGHFASLQPSSVRHRCEKGSGKSKGFAFLEFPNYDRMKTCLKTFHHSSFVDGISPARRLNVELT